MRLQYHISGSFHRTGKNFQTAKIHVILFLHSGCCPKINNIKDVMKDLTEHLCLRGYHVY